MTSISDGSLPEDQAKAFARQYAQELQEEKQAKNDALVEARAVKEGDVALYGKTGQDLNSKIQSGQIKIV
jgi:uncharacterized protein YeaO (DUF488 family)